MPSDLVAIPAAPASSECGATSQREAALLAELASMREEQLRCHALLEVNDALRELADPGRIKSVACALLGRHAGLGRVAYVECRDDGMVFDPGWVAADWRAGDAALLAGAGWRGTLEARCATAPWVVDDVSADTRLDGGARQALLRAGSGALLAVRVTRQGRTAGFLEAHVPQPRAWAPATIALLGQAADRIEVAVRRARRDAALRASQAAFRDLVERSPFGIYVVDADLSLVQVSAGARWTFRNVRPLLGRNFADVLREIWSEPFASEALAHFRHVLATGEAHHSPSTVEHRRDVAAVESYDWKVERIAMPDGRFGVVCHFYDLSDRVQWETRLRESEARLELAAAAAEVGIYDFDLRTGGVLWDTRSRAMWGVRPDEPFSYAEFLASVHPEDRAVTGRATERVLAPGSDGRYHAEYRILHRGDGAPRWISANGQVFYEDGAAVRIVGTVQDVTARKAVETTLRAFYEVSPLMMGTVERLEDGDLLHLYDNPATSRFFGVEPGSTTGRRARELGVPESVIELWRRHYDVAGQRREPVHFEYEHVVPGGEPRLLAVTVAPLGAPATRLQPTYCYVAEDVTGRRAAEHKLATAVAELERADRRKDEFLATLSHELRNPLAPIRTAAQLLSAAGATPAQLQWAQSVIQRQVTHMAWLLDDLLHVARITQGKLALKRERVSLTSVVDAAVESARPQIDARSHQLRVDLPSEAPTLEADPLRLAQVISNLLTNAAKYTDAGGCIELVARSEGRWLAIRVRDNGIGIPPEAQPRIFDMFSQVEDSAARAEGGLGIGLALVRGLVTLHGGTVAVRSAGLGQGSEFEVRLPLGGTPHAAAAPAADPGAAQRGRGQRVLVADDNRDAADMLGLYLGMQGHEVRVAHGGRAALSLAQAFRPDVVLLDIGMPELDGYQVAEALRREPWARGLRLYAITGWGQDEDRRRARAAGFDAHLTKPVDPEALAALLDSPSYAG